MEQSSRSDLKTGDVYWEIKISLEAGTDREFVICSTILPEHLGELVRILCLDAHGGPSRLIVDRRIMI